LRAANDAFRFLLELAALASLGYWGWQATSNPVRWVLILALPFAAALVWGAFVAPKARVPVGDPWRLMLELVVFGSGIAALAGANQTTLAVAFGVAVLIHLTLTFVLGQRQPRPGITRTAA
jgi:Protein of unknown function (DUF2568)